MTSKEWIEFLIGLATVANTFWITYKAWKELRPGIKKIEVETEKTDAEIESELSHAAQVTAEGATVSSKLLMDRIKELREDLENEKRARREDAAYFRRRFREAEKEARDYRLWAAKLVKQVVEAGKIPAEFVMSPADSEQGIPSVNPNVMDKKEIRDRKENNEFPE
jgi:hypothetical protein